MKFSEQHFSTFCIDNYIHYAKIMVGAIRLAQNQHKPLIYEQTASGFSYVSIQLNTPIERMKRIGL